MSIPIPNALQVPLFPLPGIVLFPGALLPLRVFEPRYVVLLRDVLCGEKLIGMAQLKAEGFAKAEDLDARPGVFDVLGVGRIVGHEKLPDGTSRIALLGAARCRIISEIPHEPYRIANVEAMIDEMPVELDDVKQFKNELKELKRCAGILARRTLDENASNPLHQVIQNASAGMLADVLASIYVRDHTLRQTLLENTNAFARIRIVRAWLQKLLDSAEYKAPRAGSPNDEICLN